MDEENWKCVILGGEASLKAITYRLTLKCIHHPKKGGKFFWKIGQAKGRGICPYSALFPSLFLEAFPRDK